MTINKVDHPLMFTEDGVEITPGKRLYNYYDGWWGYVHPEAWDERAVKYKRAAPDGEYWDGWFRLVKETEVVLDADGKPDWSQHHGLGTLLNGARMASYKPKVDGRS